MITRRPTRRTAHPTQRATRPASTIRSRKASRTSRLSNVRVPVDTRPYFLILDMGTFCDHRLFDTAVTRLRNRYRLVYITNPDHKLPPSDIKLTYTMPKITLKHPGKVATIMISGSLWKQGQMAMPIVSMLRQTSNLIRMCNRDYKPQGILAHSGCLAQLLSADILDIPTSVLYFAPGFLPCREMPFVFDNALKQKHIDNVWRTDNVLVSKNVQSGLRYHEKLAHLIPWTFDNSKEYLGHLSKIQHLYTFEPPLVPKMTYADVLPPLTIKSVGLMKPNLPTTRFDKALGTWMYKCRRRGGRVVFVSFGSYLHNLAVHYATDDGPSALVIFLTALHDYVDSHNAHILLHDDKKTIPHETVQHIRTKMPRVRLHSSFVAYPTLIPKCAMVCFTGSVCLQNICWKRKTPMLYMPVIPEQYLWAKLYQKHTGVPFIDYLSDDQSAVSVAVKRAFAWAKTKGAKTLFERVHQTIPRDAGYEVMRCVEEWGVQQRNESSSL